MCFQSSSLVDLCDIFPSRINGKIFQFRAKLIKHSLQRLSLPLENFLKCSALISPSNFSNLEDKLIPFKLRDRNTSVHAKDLNQLEYS